MSAQNQTKQMTAPDFKARKGGDPLVCLTAYTTRMAEIMDPHVEMMLVGDSVGMVMHGLKSTLQVSLEMMLMHGASVVRGARQALVVVDMPFGTYESSPQQAFDSAARIMRETGCGGVKLEGGTHMAETVAFLVARGIPVMGHVGLTPQAINTLGGYRARGQSDAEERKIEEDAKAIVEAGAFGLVIEGVVETLAAKLAKECHETPIIGIGGSPSCDGQILVVDDMLGLFERVPKFVKKYAALAGVVEEAVQKYAEEVKTRQFPAPAHCYTRKS
jgi:3-methyl-2-oxobutanoate hydroxymethyltransferase